ncbi:MAG TPA: hypothetical protein PLM49_06835 [Bacteroidales bacterium]|nr:hypothetical protein [Bacteroidales bacterium]
MKTNYVQKEYYELQKQSQKWIWYLMLFLLLLNVWAIIQQVIFNIPFGNIPAPNWVLFVALGVLAMFWSLLIFSKLETKINEKGVWFRYHPFHLRYCCIEWNEIDKAYVRLYRPMKEYGGWGMRTAFNGDNGKAYNVAGNIGLQLELKNGSKVLIGTAQGVEMREFLQMSQFNTAKS